MTIKTDIDLEMKQKPLFTVLSLMSKSCLGLSTFESTPNGITQIIQKWIQSNSHTTKPLWNNQLSSEYDVELPYIHHADCPRDPSHTETIKDIGRRLRCNHADMITGTFNPELRKYFDEYSQTIKIRKSKPIPDTCYAIISERDSILPLEIVLERLAILPLKFEESNEGDHNYKTSFQCCLPKLVMYIKKWYEQTDIMPPLYVKKNQPERNKIRSEAILKSGKTGYTPQH